MPNQDDDDELFADMAALGAAVNDARDEQLHPAIRDSAEAKAEQIGDKYRK
jgi:hypothetical protein